MMKRRNFIFYSALSAAVAGLPFSGCSVPDPELDKKLAIPEILAKTYDEKTIREIGAAYGKAFPEEYNISDLERLLRKNTVPVCGKNYRAAILSAQIRMTALFRGNKRSLGRVLFHL
jgi:hypothetical protein